MVIKTLIKLKWIENQINAGWFISVKSKLKRVWK